MQGPPCPGCGVECRKLNEKERDDERAIYQCYRCAIDFWFDENRTLCLTTIARLTEKTFLMRTRPVSGDGDNNKSVLDHNPEVTDEDEGLVKAY